MNDAIVISDLHLGSSICQVKSLKKLLGRIKSHQLECEKLILNGDVFDSWDFRRLKKHQWEILSLLRNLSDKIEIIWIYGNHDGPAEIISHLLGIDVQEEYILKSGNKKVLILHGHIFDNFIVKYPLITWIATYIYRYIQFIDKSFYLAKLTKKKSKTFLRCSEQVKNKAIEYCNHKKCDLICCGHTHTAVEDGIYFNSGSWTEQPCTYLTISEGEIKLNKLDF